MASGAEARQVYRGHGGSRWDGWCLCRLPHQMPFARASLAPILESARAVRKPNPRTAPTPQPTPRTTPGRLAQECAQLASLSVQPEEATQTLRDYVRQRANLVRLSGQHVQRMQKALLLMNLKLTKVLGDVTGVTGLRIIRAIRAGERDPHQLARLRDKRWTAATVGST
jgi:hypothetical protein